MPENITPNCSLPPVREAVSIHTKKIFDSCRDKDCMEDLRFYPTTNAQALLATAQHMKSGSAEILHVDTDVEPVTFNRGFYSVDMRFYYRVRLLAYTGTPRYTEAEGLCVFDKRAILFGSEGSAKIFSSETVLEEMDIPGKMSSNLPTAVVSSVDPIVLSSRMVPVGGSRPEGGSVLAEVPAFIAQSFDSELVLTEDLTKTAYYVTLGQFTLARLERDSQMLIPVYDYSIPQMECSTGSEEDPCGLFRNVPFPVAEFFPPNTVEVPGDYNAARSYCESRG